MKSKKIIAIAALAIFTISLLSSCHRNTCPTFNYKSDVRSEVRA